MQFSSAICLNDKVQIFANNHRASLSSVMPILLSLEDQKRTKRDYKERSHLMSQKSFSFYPASYKTFQNSFFLVLFILFRSWSFFKYLPKGDRVLFRKSASKVLAFVYNSKGKVQFVLWRADVVFIYHDSLPTTDPEISIESLPVNAILPTTRTDIRGNFVRVPLTLTQYGMPVPWSIFQYFGTFYSISDSHGVLLPFPNIRFFGNSDGFVFANENQVLTCTKQLDSSFAAELKTVSSPLAIFA